MNHDVEFDEAVVVDEPIAGYSDTDVHEEIVLSSEPASSQPLATSQDSSVARLPDVDPARSPAQTAIELIRGGLPIETLERVMDLQERWERAQAARAFTEAMARFKKRPPTIVKNKHVYFAHRDGGGATEYDHATLDECVGKIVPALAEVGISSHWDVVQKDGRVYVTCVLTHAWGGTNSVTMDGAPDGSGKKSPVQQVQSTVTFLERNTLLAVTGLAAKDTDDDGRMGARDGEEPGGSGGEYPCVTPYQAKTLQHLLDRCSGEVNEWFEGQYGPVELVPRAEFNRLQTSLAKRAKDNREQEAS